MLMYIIHLMQRIVPAAHFLLDPIAHSCIIKQTQAPIAAAVMYIPTWQSMLTAGLAMSGALKKREFERSSDRLRGLWEVILGMRADEAP